MKNYLFTLFIILLCCQTINAQRLSVDEFLSFKNSPVDFIDSLMRTKKFLRSDTAAGNMQFRFYGYSRMNGKVAELHYLQLAIKPDDTYAEIQYQTSDKTEANQFQHQLLDKGFIKANISDTLKNFSFVKNDFSIIYSIESLSGSSFIMYTFSIRLGNNVNNKFLRQAMVQL